jgi:hypothetical protein
LVSGVVEVAGAVDCIGASVAGVFELAAAGWLAAKAGPQVAMAIPAAMKSAERIWVLPGSCSPTRFPT